VKRLVRRAPKGPDEVRWDPEAGVIDLAGLEGVDAIIHLAGENVGEGRWTEARKARILQSRDAGTRLLAQAVAKVGVPRLISASAVGYYGDTGAQIVDESSPLGQGIFGRGLRALGGRRRARRRRRGAGGPGPGGVWC
jgi:NAD dependent epimerase/dehydratase family enzyme